MTDTDRMVVWLRAAMDAAQRDAEAATVDTGSADWEYQSSGWLYASGPTGFMVATGSQDFLEPERGRFMAAHDPAAVLRRIAADRKLLDLHTPEWTIVEWPDDQNGKGEAQVCRSCGNKDIDQWMNWRRRYGETGEFTEGVKPPYIVAPCTTMRLLAEGWGWTEETP